MARIRTIKPEFFTDSKVLTLTPLARLFYVSLWCEADKQGRLKWDPQTLKYRYLPADKARVEDLANELTRGGLIRLYEIDGQVFADVPSFVRHQVINNRESESVLPPYSADACLTRESGVPDAACGKEGREGKGRKEGTHAAVASEPEDFSNLMAAYPKRQGTNPRRQALSAWQAALKRGADSDQMITAAKAYAKSEVAGTRYCMQTVTWLNGDCWREAVPEAIQPTAQETEAQKFDRRAAQWAKSDKPPDQRFWMHGWGLPPHKRPVAANPRGADFEPIPTFLRKSA